MGFHSGNSAPCSMPIFQASSVPKTSFATVAAASGSFDCDVTAKVDPPQLIWTGEDASPCGSEVDGVATVDQLRVVVRREGVVSADEALVDEALPVRHDVLAALVVQLDRDVGRLGGVVDVRRRALLREERLPAGALRAE